MGQVQLEVGMYCVACTLTQWSLHLNKSTLIIVQSKLTHKVFLFLSFLFSNEPKVFAYSSSMDCCNSPSFHRVFSNGRVTTVR